MRVLPILFNEQMVKALLDGRKTQTRRVMKPQPVIDDTAMWHWKDCQWMDGGIGFPQSGIEDYAPYKPGDIIYVREAWARRTEGYIYKADSPGSDGCGWRPSIHMPKEAARIFLNVKNVRVERLNAIQFEDVISEGTPGVLIKVGDPKNPYKKTDAVFHNFQELWDSCIKEREKAVFGWGANPWVWAISFERCEKP